MGARNAAQDKARIRKMRQLAKEIHSLTVELEPNDDDMTPEEKIGVKASNLDAPIGGGGYHMSAHTEIKTAGDWELDVLGVPFGDEKQKDSDGEYFVPETKTFSEQFPSPPVMYYHGFDPNGKPMGEPAIIGKVQKIWKDVKGWWYRVVLDRASDLAKRIWESAKQGKARASSGSIAHLVRREKDGKIINWPVVELSLIDAEGKRQPANQYAVAMLAAKAHYQQAGLTMPAELSEGEPEGMKAGEPEQPKTIIVNSRGEQWILSI